MKQDQLQNLLCRMAGNIFNEKTMTHATAAEHAIRIFLSVESILEQTNNGEDLNDIEE